jgi:hypothetical protein
MVPPCPACPDFNWISEIVRAAVTVGGVALGGYISWQVTAASLNRNADRAEKLDREKQTREALLERLAMQRVTYQEFMNLFAKHQSAPIGGPLEGGAAKHQREKEDAAEAHNDAVAMYGKIALAFGSADFAAQASHTLEMVSAARGDPLMSTVASTLFAGKYLERMLDAIQATEKQLALPALALVPEPLLPSAEYSKQLKKMHLGDLAERYGLDRKRAEDIVNNAHARAPNSEKDGA